MLISDWSSDVFSSDLLPRLREWLTETQPDIVCLQELKTSDETFPEKDIRDIGYGCIWHGQKGFKGVAILARGEDPVEVKRGIEGEPEDEPSRYNEADVKCRRDAMNGRTSGRASMWQAGLN